MDNKINRDWRNWNSPQKDGGTGSSEGSGINPGPDGEAANPFDALKIKQTKSNLNTDINNIKLNNVAKKRFKNIQPNKKISLQALKNKNSWCDGVIIDCKERAHKSHEEWSTEMINHSKVDSFTDPYERTRDRRLAFHLASMISKIAEDRSGNPVMGEDDWDMDELLMRGITKRNIYQCKYSKDKERLALVLDSSPSCSRMAEFYGKISYLASQIGSLDIYLAPNGVVTHVFNPKTREYDRIFDISDETDSHMVVSDMALLNNFFANRTIMFFGDTDGSCEIIESCSNNEVYWLVYDRHDDFCVEVDARNFAGKWFICNEKEDLINITRKMR